MCDSYEKKSYGQKDRHKDKDRNVRTLPLEHIFFTQQIQELSFFFFYKEPIQTILIF